MKPSINLLAPTPTIRVTPLGMCFQGDTGFETWSALAMQIGRALRSLEFSIGDCLVYGDENFSRPGPGRPTNCNYEAAIRATGMDAPLLRDYAYVSRHVHRSRRTDKLSWTHHRLVAKLPPEKQEYWLELAANHAEHISVKRLRKSICADRLVSLEELKMPAGDRVIITHIPPINRLTMWWEDAGGRDWLRTRSKPQLRNMLVDFSKVIEIIKALQSEYQMRPDDQ